MGKGSFLCFVLAAAYPLARCQPGGGQSAGDLSLISPLSHFCSLDYFFTAK